MAKFLMCPPNFFDVDYEINPWMHSNNKVDHAKAMEEWLKLKQTYLDLGCQVEELSSQDGWPDLVFTANAGLKIGPQKFLLSKFRYPQRQGEEPFDRQWFEDHGWEVVQPDAPFEGQGEAFNWNNQILAGFGFRSNDQTAPAIARAADKNVIPLELIDPRFYHLDMALAPINENLIVYNPDAFSNQTKQRIKDLGVKLIECLPDDALAFGCNLVRIDQNIIMVKGANQLADDLHHEGFNIIQLEMTEFRKSGGGVRCLTLDI